MQKLLFLLFIFPLSCFAQNTAWPLNGIFANATVYNINQAGLGTLGTNLTDSAANTALFTAAQGVVPAGSILQLPAGTYHGTWTITRDNIWIRGALMPAYDLTNIAGGTILCGEMKCNTHVNLKFSDFGIDERNTSDIDAIQGGWSNSMTVNVELDSLCLVGRGYSISHGVVMQGGHGLLINDVKEYYFDHGMAMRLNDFSINNCYSYGMLADAIIVKSGSTGGFNTAINGTINNCEAYGGQALLNIQSTDTAAAVTQNINVNNFISTNSTAASVEVWQATGLTSAINLSNINSIGSLASSFNLVSGINIQCSNCQSENSGDYGFLNIGATNVSLLNCFVTASEKPVLISGNYAVAEINGIFLVNALTLSYSGPKVYAASAAITPLSPTSSKVAAPAYGSATTIDSGFNVPAGIAVDAAGNIYLADQNNNAVKKIPGGSGAPIIIGSGFNTPDGVAVDAAGDVFVADKGNNAVKEIPVGGGAIVSLGSGFSQPFAVAVDVSGNVYVADRGNNAVKEIPAGGGAIVTLGSGFNAPTGVAVDAYGNVYVADSGNSAIKEIPAGGGAIVTLGAGFNTPFGVGVDGSGNLFVTDYGNQAVKEIPINGGSPVIIGSGFSSPAGVAIDAANNVYMTDYGNNAIKEIKPTGGYYINPALPLGLSINNGTGIISGIPVGVSPATNYTINAYNSFGSNTATVNLKVVIPNANLAALSISSGTLSPVFAAGVTGYTTTVTNAAAAIMITPTLADPLATVKVNGTTVASATASSAIPLSVGVNTITTVVTAQDGLTTETYTIVVTRAPSSNANISNVVLSKGTLTPAFATGTTSYTDMVANSNPSVTLTPTASDATATITVNGTTVVSGNASAALPLAIGNNTITILVTAQDKMTTNTYSVNVIRPSNNARLSALKLSSGPLSPVFSSTNTSYAVSVANTVSAVTLTPTISVAGATVNINGSEVASGTASQSIPLTVGANTITAIVTAQDGVTTNTYTVTINVALPVTAINSIGLINSSPTNAASVDYSVVFAQAVTGLTANNFSLSQTGAVTGASINSVSGSGTTYQVLVNTGTGDGSLGLNLANGTGLSYIITNTPFTGTTYTIDKTPPTVSNVVFTTSDANPSAANVGDLVTLSFTASEALQNNNIVFTIAGAGEQVINTTGNNYTVSHTITSSDITGPVEFSGPLTDLAGNTYNFDQVSSLVNSPPVTINAISAATPAAYPVNAASVDYTVTFGTAVTGLSANNFLLATTGAVTGASINSVSGSGSVYDVNINTGSGDGTIQLSLGNATGLSSPVSTSLPFAGDTYTIDKTPPSVSNVVFTTSDANPSAANVGDVVTLSFTASEALQNNDIVFTIAGAGEQVINTTGNNYTVSHTITSSDITGPVEFSGPLTDLAGNTYNFDQVSSLVNSPPVTINAISAATPAAYPVNAASVDYTVTFGTAVTGLSANNFLLATTGAVTGASINSVSGSGSVYDVNINTGSGDGTIQLSLGNATGLSSPVSTSLPFAGDTYTIDKTPPSVSNVVFTTSDVNPSAANVGDVVTLSFTASEALQNNDIVFTIAGAGEQVINTTGNNYTVSHTITSSDITGPVEFSGPLTDLAGNTYNFDQVSSLVNSPPVTINAISAATPAAYPVNAASVDYTVTFGTAVTGLSANNFLLATTGAVTGASINSVSGSGSVYDVNINTGSGDGTIQLSLGNATGLSSPVSTPLPFAGDTYTIDKTPPTVSNVVFTTSDANPSAANVGDLVTLSFTASEALQNNNIVFTIAGAGEQVINTTGNNYMVSHTITSSDITGPVEFSGPLTDLAGNTYNFDQVSSLVNSPPVTINAISAATPAAYPVNAASVDYTVTFGTAVTGLSANNFLLATTGAVTGASINSVSGSGSVYDVNINTGSGDGTIQLSLGNATGLSSPVSTSLPFAGDTYTIDKTPPSVSNVVFTTSDANPSAANVGDVVTLSFTASEALQNNDIVFTIAGAGEQVINTTGNNYTVSHTITSSDITGPVEFSGPLTDLAGNTYNFDQVSSLVNSPPVTINAISAATPAAYPVNAASVDYTVTFGTAVTGLSANNFLLATTGAVTGASINSVSGSGSVYDVNINTGSGDGTIQLSLGNATGLSSPVSTSLPFAGDTYTIDKTPPSVSAFNFASNNANNAIANIGNAVTLYFTTSEAVQTPAVTIAGNAVTASLFSTDGAAFTYSAQYTLQGSDSPDANGNVPYEVDLTDLAGNTASFTELTTGVNVAFNNTPLITSTGTLSALSSPAGSPSAPASFSISAINLQAAIMVSAPAGFEVSTDNSNFSSMLTTGAAGTIASTTIFVRLAAADPANTYSGNVVLSSPGATTINVAVPLSTVKSTDAALAGLTLSGGTLSPAFSPVITSYNIAVGNGLSTMTATPIADNPNATIVVAGQPVTTGTQSQYLTLSVGVNTIPVTVTAQDGVTAQTYTLVITEAKSANANLSFLKPGTGTLAPTFTAGTTSYSESVNYAVSALTLIPTTTDPTATVKINGSAVISGSASQNIPLAVGSNVITTVVTAQNGTTKTYTLTVTRGAPATVAALSGLTISSGTLTPEFVSTTTAYTASVSYPTTSMTITPTAGSAYATIMVNGAPVSSGTTSQNLALAVGSNTITIMVTAQNGTTSKTYTVIVTRALSNNDNLANLTISNGTLTPAFATTNTSYIAAVPSGITSMTITPTTADPAATIKVNGQAVSPGTASQSLPLAAGGNTLTIAITAPDGITQQTYTLTVNKAALSSNAGLANLTISNGALTPAFVTGTANYTAAVGNGLASMTITPTTADPGATVTVNGAAVTSGTASQSLPLAVGTNSITTVVTAADGTKKSYSLVVTEAKSNNDNLAFFKPGTGTLNPTFTSTTTSYTESVANTVTSITITPTTAVTTSTVTINGTAVTSGTASSPIMLSAGVNTLTGVVTAQNGATKTYTLTVTRATGGMDGYNPGVSMIQPTETPGLADDGILIHQAVSPNGDGINDFLQIDNISQYPHNKLSIMNRNGQLIYEVQGYDNNSKVFDGHNNKNGQMQLPGTYFYQLDYTANGITKHKTGFLVLKY